eukprot:gene40139-14470_t
MGGSGVRREEVDEVKGASAESARAPGARALHTRKAAARGRRNWQWRESPSVFVHAAQSGGTSAQEMDSSLWGRCKASVYEPF